MSAAFSSSYEHVNLHLYEHVEFECCKAVNTCQFLVLQLSSRVFGIATGEVLQVFHELEVGFLWSWFSLSINSGSYFCGCSGG